jgi:multidrug resistance protein, MATE family
MSRMPVRGELKPMLRLAVPVVLAELGWMSMGIVDTIMVSPIGPAAIGAAGIGTSLHMAFAVFGMGLLLGLDTFVSQAYGARDVDDCHRWLVQGVWLAARHHSLDGRSASPCSSRSRPRLPPGVMPPLQGYFAIVIWSTLPLLLYAAFRRYLQACTSSRR